MRWRTKSNVPFILIYAIFIRIIRRISRKKHARDVAGFETIFGGNTEVIEYCF